MASMPPKKAAAVAQLPPVCPRWETKRLLRLRKYFYKGNINHYAHGKAQADGEEALVGMPCHKGDAAADACAQAGRQRKCKSL